jgi:hypothetical protein
MSNSARLVLWMGLFMIAAGIMRNWSLISSTIFGSSSGQIYGPNGSGIPPPTGIKPNSGTGKCPPGYNSAYGRCWSPAQNPVPPSSTLTGATT